MGIRFEAHPGIGREVNGFSLVEVMVSILVLAIGVIGAAGMQLAALRTMQQTTYRSVAAQLAADMSDAITASAGRKSAPRYTDLDYRALPEVEPGVPGKPCYQNLCSEIEFADLEIYEWKARIRSVLPGGRVRICRDRTPISQSGASPTWECSGDTGSPVVIKLGWQPKNPDGRFERNQASAAKPSVVVAVPAG